MKLNIDNFCEYISKCAVESLLYEVSATPKPGLVDRNNSGAHSDMDFFTFMSSSAVLGQYFYKCSEKGLNESIDDDRELFNQLRKIGIDAEHKMFQATGGVNTHKGLVFSLGIICAATSNCFLSMNKESLTIEVICKKVANMTKGISAKELNINKKDKLTYGEKLYKKYGIKGIRGEVEEGFITVRETSFPVYLNLKQSGEIAINDILVQVLLHLMTVTEDTNVVARHDLKTLEYVKKSAKEALQLGGILTPEGKAFIEKMDEDFISKNISPGGSADLLAVTHMFYLMTEISII